MKKLRFCLSFLLTLLLLCMAGGCAPKQGSPQANPFSASSGEAEIQDSKAVFQALENYTYEMEDLSSSLDTPTPDRPSFGDKFLLWDDKLFYLWEEERGEEGGTKSTQIMSYDLNTQSCAPFFTVVEQGADEILMYSFDPNGTLYVLCKQTDSFVVFSYKDSAQVKTVKLDYEYSGDTAIFIQNTFTVDTQGNCCFADPATQDILQFDSDGKLLQSIKTSEIGGVYYFLSLEDTLYTLSWGGGMYLTKIDLETGKTGASLLFPSDAICGACSAQPLGLFIVWPANGGIQAADREGNTKELLSFSDYGLASFYPEAVLMSSTGDLLFCRSRQILRMKRVPKGENERKTLKLATFYNSEALQNAAASFNRNSEQYLVHIEDYSLYNTEADPNQGLTKLHTEIIGGNPPDVLDLRGLDAERYIKLGLLEDLYPYLDNDPELSREDFLPNILKAMGDEEGLYGVTSTFRVNTVATRSSLVDTADWSFSGIQKIIAENDQAILGMKQTRFLDLVCSSMLSHFVNWETTEVYFDSPEFIFLLETCSLLPAQADEQGIYELRARPNPKVGFVPVVVEYLDISRDCEQAFGEPETYIGYPETGSTIGPRMYLTMLSSGKEKEAVWSFLRTVLLPEFQNADGIWNFQGFPTRKDSLDKLVEGTLHPDGEEYLANAQTGEVEEMNQPEKEQVDRVLNLIESVNVLESSNTVIKSIVLEEAAAYFAGSKTAQETADIIQDRVTTYVRAETLA